MERKDITLGKYLDKKGNIRKVIEIKNPTNGYIKKCIKGSGNFEVFVNKDDVELYLEEHPEFEILRFVLIKENGKTQQAWQSIKNFAKKVERKIEEKQ